LLYKPLPRYLDDLAAFVLAITVLLSHPNIDWMSLSQKKSGFPYRVIKAMASIYLECTSWVERFLFTLFGIKRLQIVPEADGESYAKQT
jgi:hypothetical protein